MSRTEIDIISKIVNRAEAMGLMMGKRITLVMDIEYCNLDVPLDLLGLLAADSENFAHDVVGIQRHFDRQQLKLRDFFVPRFALNQG